MSNDPVNEYLESRARFVDLDKDIDNIANLFKEAERNLDFNRNNFMFANTAEGMPEGVVLNPQHKKFNAEQWPTPQKINEKLGEWHREKKKLVDLWNNIDQPKKDGLSSPPHSATKEVRTY